MNAPANVPNTRYHWQQSYLAAALETDAQLLPSKITEARRDIRRRLSDCAQIDESEQSAVANAINAHHSGERTVEVRRRPERTFHYFYRSASRGKRSSVALGSAGLP
jgi:hypothetical protein